MSAKPVRAAVESDVASMSEVARRAFLTSLATFYSWPAVQHWVASDLGAKAAAGGWGNCLVAENEDKEVVGWVEVDAAQGTVVSLWVHPDYQHNAIGTALLLNAEAKLVEGGVQTPSALVATDNLGAFGFFNRLGWTVDDSAVVLVAVAPGVNLDHVKFVASNK